MSSTRMERFISLKNMQLVTREEMIQIDRKAIAQHCIPSLMLMENAGRGIARSIRNQLLSSKIETSSKNPVSMICGKGSNGGDGFVAARILSEAGIPVQVFLAAPLQEYQGDAKINLHRLGFPVEPLDNSRFLKFQADRIGSSSWIVDALFGTGLDRPIRGYLAQLIRFLNQTRIPIVSIDIPSGLCATTGKRLGEAIRANITLTLHLPKQGLVLGPDSECTGDIQVIPIGIPAACTPLVSRKEFLVTPELFRPFFKARPKQSHKNQYGHVLTVAGSYRKIGAALLASRAALRAGAGLSTLALPECAYQGIDPRFSEIMFEPQTSDNEHFSIESADSILKLTSGKSAIALGPGMGVSDSLLFLIQRLFQYTTLPVVIDADALNCIALKPDLLLKGRGVKVLTPHPGEFLRLARLPKNELEKNREDLASKFARKYKVFLVLKGYRSLIATPRGEIYLNPTGNPAMATAGAGDVLTGIIAGLIAQKIPVEQAVLAGVWIHGRAGDRWAKREGERGLVAWDIVEGVPSTIQEIQAGF